MGQQTGRQTGALTAAEFLFTYLSHFSVIFLPPGAISLKDKKHHSDVCPFKGSSTYELNYSHFVLFIACRHLYFVKGKQLQYLLSGQ